jgi:hypothetical protein
VEGNQVLEHFQEKWLPVFRQKMRPIKKARALSDSAKSESALRLAQGAQAL